MEALLEALRSKPAGQLMAVVLAAALPAFADKNLGELSYTEWTNIGVLVAGVVVVWITDNQPKGVVWHYTRALCSIVAAVGVTVISATSEGGVTQVEIIQIVVAFFGAFMVYQGEDAQSVGKHARS